LGITNPSAVRRLRDKYQQQFASSSKAPVEPANNVIALSTRTSTVRREPVRSHAVSRREATKPAAASDEVSAGADEHPATVEQAGKPDLFAAAYAASIATAKTAIHLQYKSFWFAFQVSPYAMFLRNTEFTRLVLSSLQERHGPSR
jgi:hypothetical protein